MTVNDLFVNYKSVDPVEFDIPEFEEYQPMYINLNRAQRVTSTISNPEVSSEESVNFNESPMDTWKVHSYEPNGIKPQGHAGKSYTTEGSSNINKALYWMHQFEKFGINPNQQIALVAAMKTECGLEPRGAVNQLELQGKGNTKAGWAHAGEGSIGFTHWDTKKKYIQMYNEDPRRKGPKLSTNEAEYAKSASRHIADLDDEDQALITILFYGDVLKKTQNMNFNDLMGEFYMEKAGRGFGNRKNAGTTPYDKAVFTGKIYQQTHERLGYTNAAKHNTFIQSLDYAKNLANQLGYIV